jgi:myo-inositol-1(or 4)-monophosphatase
VLDLTAIRQTLETLVTEAGEIALQVRANHERALKADGSLVTLADRKIESFLRCKLPDLVPGTTVWGEEEGHSLPGENGLWVIDPVDGTSNYSFGSPLWGVTIALVKDGQIVVGAIYLPDMHQVFSAHLGGGATCNGVQLAPIPPGEIADTELVSYSDLAFSEFSKPLPGKMRYAGAFVAEAMFMARGVFRGLISQKANLYDIAASVLILTELGAEAKYVDGTEMDLDEVIQLKLIPKSFSLFPGGCSYRF